MKPNGNALTLTVGRRENTHFQKPLSNGTPVPVPKLLILNIWLIIHRSHGTLAFTDASDLPKPLDRRVAHQKLWWKRMHLYEVRYEVYTRSIRGGSIWFVQELATSF